MKPFVLLAVLLALASIASADDSSPSSDSIAVGLWLGIFETESGTVRFDVEVRSADQQLQAVLVLHSEGGMRMSADYVELADNQLRLEAMGGAIALDGRIEDNLITGRVRLPASERDMRLARAGSTEAADLVRQADEQIQALRAIPLTLVRAGPAMERIDEQALAALLQAAEDSFTTALALMHQGELVGEWFRGEEPRPIETMSVTKIVLNLIIGRLVTLGQIESIDTPVHHYYPQWAEDEQRAAITLRHLLTHTSGVDRGQPAGPIYQSEDFVRFALQVPLEFEPGTDLAYSNNATNLIAGIISQAIDQPLQTFLADDLFGLIGIESFFWAQDRAGNPHGMAGLAVTAGDLARLGQLALNRGNWDGKQLIDSDWFDASFQTGSEHSRRVGLLWLLDYEDEQLVGVSHSGHLGQWLGIRFDNGIVGARLIAQSPAYQQDTDAFGDFLTRLATLPAH